MADHHGKGRELLSNCKQLLDTNMSGLGARRELAGDVNTGTVCAPAQRRGIGIESLAALNELNSISY